MLLPLSCPWCYRRPYYHHHFISLVFLAPRHCHQHAHHKTHISSPSYPHHFHLTTIHHFIITLIVSSLSSSLSDNHMTVTSITSPSMKKGLVQKRHLLSRDAACLTSSSLSSLLLPSYHQYSTCIIAIVILITPQSLHCIIVNITPCTLR